MLGWDGIIFILRGNYKGGAFKFYIEFPENFPNESPEFRFVTPVFSPYVSPDGKV